MARMVIVKSCDGSLTGRKGLFTSGFWRLPLPTFGEFLVSRASLQSVDQGYPRGACSFGRGATVQRQLRM